MPTLAKKIFLSSTFIDLKEYREAAVHACQRVGLLPVFMEGFPPDPRNAVAVCKATVEGADLFLGLYAHRYGYVPDGSKVSITEMEYKWARKRGLPPFLFVVDPDYPWPPTKVDKGSDYERLERFKARIGKQHVLRKFRDPQTLKEDILLLGTELARAEPEAPASTDSKPPSPRRVLPALPEMHSVPPYILTTRFVGRRKELDALDTWARSAGPMLVVEAIGGMGKSALTWEWAQERAPQAVTKHSGTLWWSFYEGGASIASFVREALAYVTETDPESLRSVPQEEQAQRLFTELRRRPFLLVLDGFERLLTAYHRLDPSKLRDEEVPPDHRSCTNPRTEDLLRQLTACSPSKVLVTTRLMPSALKNRAHQPMPGVQHLELRGLDPADGENLLRSLGVHGASATIRQFLRQFDNHSLLIGVLAGRILDYRPSPGNFDRWRGDFREGGGLHLSDLDLKQRRTHILAYAFDGLDSKRKQLLSRIAVLSDAADYATLFILNPRLPPKPEKHLPPLDLQEQLEWDDEALALHKELESARKKSEGFRIQKKLAKRTAFLQERYVRLQAAREGYLEATRVYTETPEYLEAVKAFDTDLTDLENRGLLQWDRLNNIYDLHPVVRGYAFEQLEQTDRVQTYGRIRDHFESLLLENEAKATELSDLKNTLQIYRALIGGGQFDLAKRLYQDRLSSILFFSITSYPTIVELLTPMFREGFGKLPTSLTSIADQSWVASELGLALSRLGKEKEASTLKRLTILADLKSKNWHDLSTMLCSYSATLQRQNYLAASLASVELSKQVSQTSGNTAGINFSILAISNIFTIEGRWDEAQAAHEEFTSRPPPPLNLCRSGAAEAILCWLKFYRGVLCREELQESLAVAVKGKNLPSQQNIYELWAELALQEGALHEALEVVERALDIARKTGAPASYAQGCLACAMALQGRNTEARSLVEEADVPFWQAAEVYLEIGDLEKAKEFALKAYKSAWADGPPHIRWWELERSRQLLTRLGIPEPQLPPFDPSKVEPIPFEAEIRAAIEELEATTRNNKRKEDDSTPLNEETS